MTIFVTVLHALVCLVLIFVVLMQRGKGAEIGAVFGGGAGTTLFGSRGAGNFLTKLTTCAAVIFMATSFYLAYVAIHAEQSSIYDAEEATPAAPNAAPAAAVPAPPGAGDFVEVPAAGSQPTAPAPSAQASAEAAKAPASEKAAAESSGTTAAPSGAKQ